MLNSILWIIIGKTHDIHPKIFSNMCTNLRTKRRKTNVVWGQEVIVVKRTKEKGQKLMESNPLRNWIDNKKGRWKIMRIIIRKFLRKC